MDIGFFVRAWILIAPAVLLSLLSLRPQSGISSSIPSRRLTKRRGQTGVQPLRTQGLSRRRALA